MRMTPEQRAAATALLPDMDKFSAIPLMRAYQAAYKVILDWHEFSELLDQLQRTKVIRYAGFDRYGHHQYEHNQEE